MAPAGLLVRLFFFFLTHFSSSPSTIFTFNAPTADSPAHHESWKSSPTGQQNDKDKRDRKFQESSAAAGAAQEEAGGVGRGRATAVEEAGAGWRGDKEGVGMTRR